MQGMKLFVGVMLVAGVMSQLGLRIVYPKLKEHVSVYIEGELQPQYDDTLYQSVVSCQNGGLQLLQFNSSSKENIVLSYEGISDDNITISISVSPNQAPYPVSILNTTQKEISLQRNCPPESEIDSSNYYNKVDVSINKDRFSFLMNCDLGHRHKKFQYGYMVLAIVNAAVIVGVAMRTRLWSIKWRGRCLSMELKWHRFLILMIVLVVIGSSLFFLAKQDGFEDANRILRYAGLIIAVFFVFLCLNQVFFIFSSLQAKIWKFYRYCDVLSIVFTLVLIIVGFFVENWIFYDLLALCICIGGIKILRFYSLRQALLSILISVLTGLIVSIILHFVLERSYNDYASELSSPLFLMVPDLINNLFKKCSWLPVIDIIIPGVLLAYLRRYDENFDSGWGGVYTVIGNTSFILGTIIWILLEALYPYSIPFSFITYVFLFASILLTSLKRNQLQTLWDGRFYTSQSVNEDFLSDNQRKSFDKMIDKKLLDNIKGIEEEPKSEIVE